MFTARVKKLLLGIESRRWLVVTSDGSAFEWKVWISNAITACPSSCLGVSLTFYPQTMDFDLSTSTPPDSTASEKVVSAMKNALGLENYLVADIGVFNGIYYGILSQYKFSAPSGVAHSAVT
jgi:hypothetical protein